MRPRLSHHLTGRYKPTSPPPHLAPPLVDEPPRKRHKSDTKSWTEGSEIDRVLAQIADAIGDVFVVDSESAEAAIQPDYKPNQQIVVRIAKSNKLLVVINVKNESKTHLVLAVVDHKCLAAHKVILMDSFPIDGTLAVAQLCTDSIVKCYLPKTAIRQRRIISQLSNIQSDQSDCDIFVFVFAVSAMTNQALPGRIDISLWRRIMKAVLDAKGSDLVIEVPGQNGVSQELEMLDAWNETIPPCTQVLQALKRRALQHFKNLGEQIEKAVHLEGMKNTDQGGLQWDHGTELEQLKEMESRAAETETCMWSILGKLETYGGVVSTIYTRLEQRGKMRA
ncbi:hypothetical protein CPLU01_16011 [Colletotrichum plurivorum]|uniref:Uncharacterized protein n=1 Tax=Colletotrichum plurivorum TaxID=2175906 RepID=A0A8H6J355_9PEZI|nr:hypothetical protein CPLU01_16011 [Colletotrichum plurivorum]